MRCSHQNTADYTGRPDPSGRCPVYEVCEDCGRTLRQMHETDSVL